MFVLKVFSTDKWQICTPVVNDVLYSGIWKMGIDDESVLGENTCDL